MAVGPSILLFMMKFFLLLICCGVAGAANAQSGKLIVTLVDDHSQPVTGALVRIEKQPLHPAEGPQGTYVFNNIQPGAYKVTVTMEGYKSFNKSVTIKNQSFSLPVILHPDMHILEEVVVHNRTLNERKNQEQLNLEIVKSDFIQKNLGGSLMQSLERLPGVKTIGIGSGQSKPLIRGMGFNRVVVIDKNIKHEGQQWGADHGLEIDQFDAEEVEVLKGAASFAYGSDAIAGAINIKPAPVPAPYSFGGAVNLIGKTNNALYGTSVNVYGRTQKWLATARLTLQDYADYRVPADSVYVYDFPVHLYKHHLRNTAGKELSLHASLGYVTDKMRSVFYIDNNYSKSGFFANAHGLEPRRVDATLHDRSSRDILKPSQQVNHFKLINQTQLTINNHAIALEAGYQNNHRKEYNAYTNHGYMPAIYPATMTTPINLEREFNKKVYSLNVKDKLQWGRHDLQLGINGEIQNNTIGGWSFLVPAFNQKMVGAFGYDKFYLNEKAIIHGAIRYDYADIDIKSYADWFASPADENNPAAGSGYIVRAANTRRHFNSLTGSVGINYNLRNIELKANVGKSYRVPIAKELAANGVNYHYFSYEKGNPLLDAEESYQADAGAVFTNSKWRVQLSPFFNYFPNYIYLNPTAAHDYLYGAGNQVFEYTQSRVLRYGGELQVRYHIRENLSTEVLGEYLYAEQLSGNKKGFTLPFSPPPSVLINLSYEPIHTGLLKRTYLSVDYRITAAQNKIVPPERKTDSYTVMNIQAGTRFSIQKQEARLSVQLQNVFNKRYLVHTSFYRLIGLPEQGRNLVVSLQIPFSFVKQKQEAP